MSFTVSNTTADISGICGNATYITQVHRTELSCTQTTAGIIPVSIALRSTGYTGTVSTITSTGLDPNFSIAISSAFWQSNVGLTNGTLSSYIGSGRIGVMAAATATPKNYHLDYRHGARDRWFYVRHCALVHRQACQWTNAGRCNLRGTICA